MKVLAICFVAVLLGVGCVSDRSQAKVPFYSFEQRPTSLAAKVPVNGEYRFELAENATTGYLWGVESHGNAVSTVIDHQGADSRLCGAPGKAVVVMKAMEAGVHQLTLKYQRAWEKEAIYVIPVTLTAE